MVSYYIITITVLISLAAWYVSEDLMLSGMLRPYYTFRENRWYQLITHGLLHADFTHLLFNMITFYFFAPYIEQQLGVAFLVGLYFAGLIGSALPSLFKHKNDPNYASLGASGAVESIIFSFILFNPMTPLYIFFIPIGIPAILFALLFVGYSIYADKRGSNNINHLSHLTGSAIGIVYTLIFRPDAIDWFIRGLGF